MERRSSRRTQILLKARAICRPNDAPVECLIVDVSGTGARLQFVNGGISTLPDRFELLVAKTGERPFVQVAWRHVDEMGVKFNTEDS
jgi:PilZ domain